MHHVCRSDFSSISGDTELLDWFLNALYRRSKADEVGVGNASHHDKVHFWIPAQRNLLFIFGPSLQCFPPKSGSLLSHSFSVFVSVVTVGLSHAPFLQVLRSCHCLVTCSSCRPRMHGKYGLNGGSFIVSSSHVSSESFLILKDTDILHLKVPGQSIIVLNSYEAAKELLERRSAIYSSR